MTSKGCEEVNTSAYLHYVKWPSLFINDISLSRAQPLHCHLRKKWHQLLSNPVDIIWSWSYAQALISSFNQNSNELQGTPIHHPLFGHICLLNAHLPKVDLCFLAISWISSFSLPLLPHEPHIDVSASLTAKIDNPVPKICRILKYREFLLDWDWKLNYYTCLLKDIILKSL